MKSWNKMKRKRKKTTPFVPTHSEIEKAVQDYLNNGGKITKLEADDSNYFNYVKNGDSSLLADEFLSEQ
jgi:hypothetical protein